MKKLLIILLSAIALTVMAQQKTVAVLDPICRDNSVNGFYQQIVRGAMESAVTASTEYEAYDRSAFDQIQKEQAFQRTGAVSDSQIKRMGEMAGVDYVLVSEVSAYEGYLSAVIKILNVTTGRYDKSRDEIMQLNPEIVKGKCNNLASSLFGEIPYSNSKGNNNSDENRKILAFLLVNGNFYSEGNIPRLDILNPNARIVARDDHNKRIETSYVIKSFTMRIYYPIPSKGDTFSQEQIDALNRLKKGTLVSITDIIMASPTGREEKLPPMALIMD